MENKNDYSNDPVNGIIVINEVQYPYTVYPDFYKDGDQMASTGNAKVLAITPSGTISFTVYGEEANEKINESEKILFSNLPEEYQQALLDAAKKVIRR